MVAVSGSGWFWCTVLFFVPAGVIAVLGWRERRRGSEPVRNQPNRAAGRVAAQVALAISMILAGLIAIPMVRTLDFPSALMPLGLLALSGASWWLLMVRPRWAAAGLAVTAIFLPAVLFLTAPLFLVDPHEVPPGPNPETVFLFTAVVVLVYCIPALIASACAANATSVAGQESPGHRR